MPVLPPRCHSPTHSSSFFGLHETQIAALAQRQLAGFDFGYKRSFRNKKFFIRSVWQIKATSKNHFIVEELQRSSGHHETLNQPVGERSNGIAISKSRFLWFVLREQAAEQPRVMCFNVIATSEDPQTRSVTIVGLSGYAIELDLKFTHGLFHTPVLLLRAPTQQHALEDYASELDILPSSKWQREARRVNIGSTLYHRIVAFLFADEPFFTPGL